MHGFAFQVNKLVSEIEDDQLLHELSLEDDVDIEELPSELNLSEVSCDSSMSGAALLPPDPVSDDPVLESGVAWFPWTNWIVVLSKVFLFPRPALRPFVYRLLQPPVCPRSRLL